MAERNPQSVSLSPEELNRLVNEDALPAPEDERPVFVMPGKQRPWPRATTEELVASQSGSGPLA
jgi:hypothetical protein